MPRASIERVLPRARLRDLDGVERDLQRGRGPQVVVRCGSAPDRLRYVESLASRAEELREWGAGLFAIVPDARLTDAQAPAIWLVDAESGAAPEPAVLVTDEWGEVYFEALGGAPLPDPDEIVEWVRFVAIQCPECENPEGGWRDL